MSQKYKNGTAEKILLTRLGAAFAALALAVGLAACGTAPATDGAAGSGSATVRESGVGPSTCSQA